jgi:hypothetical protein
MSEAEKIGSIKAVTTVKLLTANGKNPVFEVSAISGKGTLAGVEIMQTMSTYTAELGPDGVIYGECPNAGMLIAADGVATFRASGIGTFTEDGGSTFKGIVYIQTSAPSLVKLNGAAIIYDWNVDAEGNADWQLWHWK